jgi:hypothetical protein
LSQFAEKNNNFWSKIPHEIYDHWIGRQPSFLKIVHKLSSRVNPDGELEFSARKLANEVGIHVSNVSRFLQKGRDEGLWIYRFDKNKNRSVLKFVGGIFRNIYTQAQHLVKVARGVKERFYPKRENPIRMNATPTQHLAQHPSDPIKRAKNIGLLASIREASIALVTSNATPRATQI